MFFLFRCKRLHGHYQYSRCASEREWRWVLRVQMNLNVEGLSSSWRLHGHCSVRCLWMQRGKTTEPLQAVVFFIPRLHSNKKDVWLYFILWCLGVKSCFICTIVFVAIIILILILIIIIIIIIIIRGVTIIHLELCYVCYFRSWPEMHFFGGLWFSCQSWVEI